MLSFLSNSEPIVVKSHMSYLHIYIFILIPIYICLYILFTFILYLYLHIYTHAHKHTHTHMYRFFSFYSFSFSKSFSPVGIPAGKCLFKNWAGVLIFSSYLSQLKYYVSARMWAQLSIVLTPVLHWQWCLIHVASCLWGPIKIDIRYCLLLICLDLIFVLTNNGIWIIIPLDS